MEATLRSQVSRSRLGRSACRMAESSKLGVLLCTCGGRLRESGKSFAADARLAWRELRPQRFELVALAVVILAGILARLVFISEPVRADEAYTYRRYVEKGLREVLCRYSKPNNHIFHTWLVWLSTSIFGGDLWALRLPAFLGGVLLIPASFFSARSLFSRRAGLLTAGLVAVSPCLVLYSTNARGYILICVFTMLLLPVLRYALNSGSLFGGAIAAALCTLGLYTVPIMAFPMAMAFAWCLLDAWRRGGRTGIWRAAKRLFLIGAAASLITLLLYVPPMCRSGPHKVFVNRYTRYIGADHVLSSGPAAFHMFQGSLYFGLVPGLGYMLSVGVLLALLLSWWRNRGLLLLALAIPATIIPLLFMKGRVPPSPRSWIFLLPICFCLADAGISWLTEVLPRVSEGTSRAVLALLAVATALCGGAYVAAGDKIMSHAEAGAYLDGGAVARYMKPRLGPDDRLAVTLPCKNYLRYHFKQDGIPLERIWSKKRPGSGKLYFLVYLKKKQKGDWAYALRSTGFSPPEGTILTPVKIFPNAMLYLVVPRNPGAAPASD